MSEQGKIRAAVDQLIKPKVTKSRNGCLTCKKKRLKCDETKPACLNCSRKKITCGGYATKFKWRSFNDNSQGDGDVNLDCSERDERKRRQSVDRGENEKRKHNKSSSNSSSDKVLRRHLELASLSVTGKSIKDINRENELIDEGLNPDIKEIRNSGVNNKELENTARLQSNPHDIKRSHSFSSKSDYASTTLSLNSPMQRSFSTNSNIPFEVNSIRSEHANMKSKTNRLDSLADVVIDEINGRSPSSLADSYLHTNQPTPVQIPFSPNLSDFLGRKKSTFQAKDSPRASSGPSPRILENGVNTPGFRKDLQFNDLHFNTPTLSALINYAFGNEDEKSLEPDIRLHVDIPLSPLNLSNTSDNNLSSDITASNRSNLSERVIDGKENQLALLKDIKSPVSFDTTPGIISNTSNNSLMKTVESEQILFLYSEYTCAIMSIKNGPNENPWRNMIIPLAYSYPCLFNSIASMTLFHLAGNNEIRQNSGNLRARGYMHMKKCILELASGLSKVNNNPHGVNELPCDIALTTCLNLAVSESWDTHTSSGIAHLKGAKSLIQKVLSFLKEVQGEIESKKKHVIETPGSSEDEYVNLVSDKKRILSNKLVLVSELEWDKMFEDDNFERHPEIKDSSYHNLMNGSMNKKSHVKFNVAIPRSLQFLFNIWIYFEVLAQMTTDCNCDDKGVDLVATITSILQSSQERKKEKESSLKHLNSDGSDRQSETSPTAKSESSDSSYLNGDTMTAFSLFEGFDPFSSNTEYVDPLLGFAQSLFSIMGKVANLISKIRKSKLKDVEKGIKKNNNRLSTITTATQLKQQLIEWKPTITSAMLQQANSGGMCDDSGKSSTWDISACLTTAEAYRYATLLYLHQAVPEIPSLTSQQLAEKIFILLASIPVNSHTYVVHIFPLLISSCEAEPGEEREWCLSRWSLLSEKMWIGNIDRALEVVKEVWRRKDDNARKRRRTGLDAAYVNEVQPETTGDDDEHLRNISNQISGLMAVINNDQNTTSFDDVKGGITSRLHWSTVMKEWGWEVLLG